MAHGTTLAICIGVTCMIACEAHIKTHEACKLWGSGANYARVGISGLL